MRTILFFLFTVNGFLNPLNSQTLSKTILFEERVFNFGTIKEAKGVVTHSFVFKNTGKASISVTDVQSSCGCIGNVVTQSPVKPGAKGKVTILFDPSYKSGFFSKEIIVFSNNRKEFNRIWVEGTIIPAEHPVIDAYPYKFGDGLYLRLKLLAFGYVKQGETKHMELHYANDTNEEMVLSFVTEGMKAGLRFNNPGKIAPKQKGVIRFSYSMPWNMKEDAVFRLIPYVNQKKLSEVVEVKILNEYKRTKTVVPKLGK